MSNIKKKEFYNCVTGCVELGNNYGYYATVFKKTTNVDVN